MEDKNDLLKIEKALVRVIKDVSHGRYREIKEGYTFKIREDSEYIAAVTSGAIEFKIPTLKWIPGSYEPVPGSELFLKIMNKELRGLTYEEMVEKLSCLINSLV